MVVEVVSLEDCTEVVKDSEDSILHKLREAKDEANEMALLDSHSHWSI